jgi:hypothetical protein
MSTKLTARALVIALTLGGCAGTQFRWADVARVQPGMTEAEVVAILGPPAARSQSGPSTALAWSYANGLTGQVRSVSFAFVDGRVVGSTETGRGAAPPPAATLRPLPGGIVESP